MPGSRRDDRGALRRREHTPVLRPRRAFAAETRTVLVQLDTIGHDLPGGRATIARVGGIRDQPRAVEPSRRGTLVLPRRSGSRRCCSRSFRRRGRRLFGRRGGSRRGRLRRHCDEHTAAATLGRRGGRLAVRWSTASWSPIVRKLRGRPGARDARRAVVAARKPSRQRQGEPPDGERYAGSDSERQHDVAQRRAHPSPPYAVPTASPAAERYVLERRPEILTVTVLSGRVDS